MKKLQNFDVPRTVQKQDAGPDKDLAASSVFSPPSICYGTTAAQPSPHGNDSDKHRGPYREGGTTYISVSQAKGMIEAVAYAEEVDLSLVAHLTIHWAYTNAGDDLNGKLFAKVREGLAKWLRRHGIVFAAAWCIERMSRGQAEVAHCHLLFHYRAKRKLQIEAAIYRLVKRHGRGYWAEEVIDLRIHDDPDGKYLIKGGDREVWKLFRLRKEHRRFQGIIFGKRCGVTQNIGRAARRRVLQRGAM